MVTHHFTINRKCYKYYMIEARLFKITFICIHNKMLTARNELKANCLHFTLKHKTTTTTTVKTTAERA